MVLGLDPVHGRGAARRPCVFHSYATAVLLLMSSLSMSDSLSHDFSQCLFCDASIDLLPSLLFDTFMYFSGFRSKCLHILISVSNDLH